MLPFRKRCIRRWIGSDILFARPPTENERILKIDACEMWIIDEKTLTPFTNTPSSFFNPSISRAGRKFIGIVNYIIYVIFPHITQMVYELSAERRKFSRSKAGKLHRWWTGVALCRLLIVEGGQKLEFHQLASFALINQKFGNIPMKFQARN